MHLFAKRFANAAPTALICWEIGAGFTHSQNLWGVIRQLRHRGMRCVIATADPRFETWFRSLGADVLQTYLWPAMRSGVVLPTQRPNRVLSDVFANYAVSRESDLRAAIAHYDTVFALVKPDVVLCENAFGAMIAARGRFPVVVYGSTLLFIPPIVEGAFAPIDRHDPEPSWPVDEVVDEMNLALAATARIPLQNPAEIFACDATIPFGPAAFDPYGDYRIGPVHGPHCPDLPAAMAATPSTEVVVYLHDVTQMSAPIMDALAALQPAVRIYIPSLSAELRARFEAAGHRVESRMMPLRALAATAGLLVHQGGVTLTAASLALGIPQIILSRFYENGLAGRFVANAQLGATRRLDLTDRQWLLEAVEAARNDKALTAHCRAEAGIYRRWFDRDPTTVVAEHVATLLGIGGTAAPSVGEQHTWSPI
jgi:UDP:flavonoid glycosyltransferase YjiC (YdhE family)